MGILNGASGGGNYDMKSIRAIRMSSLLLVAMALASSTLFLRADDWKTTDGKVYQNVKVIDSKPDAVTILHHDGGASIPLAKLPPDIQKRFNYDPAKARVAAAARVKDDAANARALQAEMNLASKMRQATVEAQDTGLSEANSSLEDDSAASSTTTVSGHAAHYSIDDLGIHSLKKDSTDTTHHSISELASADSMRPSLSDPAYHTMAQLAYSIHSLGSDPSDSTHHSISEIADSGL